jgi:hypothetical protein
MWVERCRSRGDITSRLTHLTRGGIVGGKDLSPVEVLVKILKEQCINGSARDDGGSRGNNPFVLKVPRTTFIVGSRPAVCFLDVPLLALSQTLSFEARRVEKHGDRVRYRGVGLSFDKRYAFQGGARPVLYEKTEVARNLLPPNEHWRIVDLDLQNENAIVDWTHEREWRAPDRFVFDRGRAAVLLETTAQYREFLRLAKEVVWEVAAVNIMEQLLA